MLITFQSSACGEVIMMAEHALALMHAAGKSYAENIPSRGVFTVEQLDAAIAGIEKVTHLSGSQDDDEADAHDTVDRPVGVAQRAFPLLDMMRKSREAKVPVVWEAGSGY